MATAEESKVVLAPAMWQFFISDKISWEGVSFLDCLWQPDALCLCAAKSFEGAEAQTESPMDLEKTECVFVALQRSSFCFIITWK